MNFLQLCQATARESGTIAGLPSFTTVANASGRIAKLVAWVADAWVQIQNERTDWLFRMGEFSHALTIGQSQYAGSDLGIADLSTFMPDTDCHRVMSLYDPAIGQADEGHILQISYERWRDCYNFGAQTNNRPVEWAISPDGKLCLGPIPDKAYTLRGRYRKAAQVLAQDGDIPIMPDDFHNLIVAEALRNMINSDEAYDSLVPKMQKYERLRYPLVIAQTPQLTRF